jgi:hypothetical protein
MGTKWLMNTPQVFVYERAGLAKSSISPMSEPSDTPIHISHEISYTCYTQHKDYKEWKDYIKIGQ